MTAQSPAVPEPPDQPDPLVETWPTTVRLFRIHHQHFRPAEFNRGPRPAGRSSFFGSPLIPVVYCAASQEVAVAETLFRDIPLAGGRLTADAYLSRVMSVLRPTQDLRLAQLHRLGISAKDLTDTEAFHYPRTAGWAEAIHRNTDVDGLMWTSRQWNNAKALVLFGDRLAEHELTVEVAGRRVFADPVDFEWLAALGQSVHIAVIPE